jgi:hypothetical protein
MSRAARPVCAGVLLVVVMSGSKLRRTVMVRASIVWLSYHLPGAGKSVEYAVRIAFAEGRERFGQPTKVRQGGIA